MKTMTCATPPQERVSAARKALRDKERIADIQAILELGAKALVAEPARQVQLLNQIRVLTTVIMQEEGYL